MRVCVCGGGGGVDIEIDIERERGSVRGWDLYGQKPIIITSLADSLKPCMPTSAYVVRF